MLTNASKHFLGLTVVAVAAAFVFNLGDVALGGINELDEIDEAWDALWAALLEWGPGDLFGVGLLLGLAVAAAFCTGLVLATRDGASTPEALAESPDRSPSYWPLAAALGAGILITGFVINTQLAILGMVVLAIAFLEWAVTSWSERVSRDPEVNSEARDRLMRPIELPVFGAALIAIPVLAVSRILLATSVNGAVVVAGAVGVVILAVFFALYARPEASRAVVRGLVIVSALAVIVGGVVAAAVGERDFEQHVGGHDDTEQVEEDGG